MEIHIATVGLTKEPILQGIRAYPVDKLFLLHSNDDESEQNSKNIQEELKPLGISCELIEVNAYALEDVILNILDIQKKHPKDNLHINLTGGTKVMASSALLAGYILGLNVYYLLDGSIERNKDKTIKELTLELPIPKTSLKELEEVQSKIIVFIAQEGGIIERANSVLNENLNISKQNASYHLKQLESKELISVISIGRNKDVSLTNTGKLFARMLLKS